MIAWVPALLEALFLVTALSLDAFIASFTYGTDNIRVPPLCVCLISLVCTSLLGVSLLAGNLFLAFLPKRTAAWISFLVLLALGMEKLFDGSVKAYLKKQRSLHREISFHAFHLRFLLGIYADPLEADADHSRSLSFGEAVALAASLSLDGLAAGFGAALAQMRWGLVIPLSFLTGVAAVVLGCGLGRRLASREIPVLPWLGGVLMIGLAATKIL